MERRLEDLVNRAKKTLDVAGGRTRGRVKTYMWYTALHQVRNDGPHKDLASLTTTNHRRTCGTRCSTRSEHPVSREVNSCARARARACSCSCACACASPIFFTHCPRCCSASPFWRSALPHELTSRVGHPHEGVRAAVVELLARVLADYPRQAMWAINGLVCSKNAARRSAGTNIVKHAQRAIERNTTNNHAAAASGYGGGNGADRAAVVAMGRRIAGSDNGDDNGARALAQARSLARGDDGGCARVCVCRVQEMASLQDDLSGWLSCIASRGSRALSSRRHDEGWRGSDPSSRGHVVTYCRVANPRTREPARRASRCSTT